MKNFFTSYFDPARKAIDWWSEFAPEDIQVWKEYCNLRNQSEILFTNYPPFCHFYGYKLTSDDVARIVFCVVIEIVRYNIINKMNRIFIGNSGGLDSATTCALLSKVLKVSKDLDIPCEVISYGLPIESNPEHNDRAKETAEYFKLHHITVSNLDTTFAELKKTLLPLAQEFSFAEDELKRGLGNAKARLRMIVNFFGTTQAGSYVMSTDNLSELYMAFWTLMGDVGAFGPIQNILKGLELPAVAYGLGVPDRTLGAKPTDGLEVHKSMDNQEGGDTDAFKGVQYPHLDAIICQAVKKGLRLDQTKIVPIDHTLIKSEYATPETVEYLIHQMVSPAAVWKRTKGSVGSAISREDLGLSSLEHITNKL